MADKLVLDRSAMKDRATSHLRIYVGNLADKATEDAIYEVFSEYGNVQGIAINRGFGFVQFESEKSAQEAIAKAGGTQFLGRTLIVRSAMSNADKARRDEENTNCATSSELPPAVALSDTNMPEPEESDDYNYDAYYNSDSTKRDSDKGGDYRDREWAGRGRGGGPRGRGRGRGARGGPGGSGGYRDRSPITRGGGAWDDRGGYDYDRYAPPPEYPRAMPEARNDCEIIVVSKALTEYAEYIEGRLKRLGIVVDLLFPMEDVPIGKVLGNIASRGCLYAILVMPANQEHRSLTLNILHGLPQEHRNMPIEDALQLISRNFAEVARGGGTGGKEAVFALLGQLADGKSLTALQYDKVIKYLQDRREQQIKVELGEPLESDKTQVDLQQRIMSILNDTKKTDPKPVPPPVVAPEPQTQKKLLDDPTVRKALDSILQKFV